jgi:hypothetical protein
MKALLIGFLLPGLNSHELSLTIDSQSSCTPWIILIILDICFSVTVRYSLKSIYATPNYNYSSIENDLDEYY